MHARQPLTTVFALVIAVAAAAASCQPPPVAATLSIDKKYFFKCFFSSFLSLCFFHFIILLHSYAIRHRVIEYANAFFVPVHETKKEKKEEKDDDDDETEEKKTKIENYQWNNEADGRTSSHDYT